jgi:hypothetical protein
MDKVNKVLDQLVAMGIPEGTILDVLQDGFRKIEDEMLTTMMTIREYGTKEMEKEDVYRKCSATWSTAIEAQGVIDDTIKEKA